MLYGVLISEFPLFSDFCFSSPFFFWWIPFVFWICLSTTWVVKMLYGVLMLWLFFFLTFFFWWILNMPQYYLSGQSVLRDHALTFFFMTLFSIFLLLCFLFVFIENRVIKTTSKTPSSPFFQLAIFFFCLSTTWVARVHWEGSWSPSLLHSSLLLTLGSWCTW